MAGPTGWGPGGWAFRPDPGFGIHVTADDVQFQQTMNRVEARLKQILATMERMANTSERSFNRAEKSAQRSSNSQIRALRSLRWQLVTIMFFTSRASRLISNAYNTMREASEQLATVTGVRALARTYEVDLGKVIESLKAVSNGTLSARQSIALAQSALIRDQGMFSSRYAELWETARVAAVVGGGEAKEIFEALVESLAEGSAQAAQTAAPILHLAYAVEQYAINTGRSVDELDRAEVANVILNKALSRTNQLLAEGADNALAQADAHAQLRAKLDDLKLVVGLLGSDEQGLGWIAQILETVTRMLVIWGTQVVEYFATITENTISLGRELVTFLGMGFDELGKWPAQLKRIFDEIGDIMPGYILRAHEDPEFQARVRERQRSMMEALGILPTEEVGAYEPELPGMLEGAEPRTLDAIFDHMMKREELIEDHHHRMDLLDLKYSQRKEDIWERYNTSIARIERNAQRARSKALRSWQNRVIDTTEKHLLKLSQMEDKYQQDTMQAARDYRLGRLHDEALYQYERGLLVAEGDVLAIEDLDARQELERKREHAGFQEQNRQRREDHLLRLQEQRDQFDLRLKQLERDYDEQLNEIRIREQDQRLEAAAQRKEALEDARRDWEQQREEQQYQHNRSLEEWAQYWTKVAQQVKIGSDKVVQILRQFYGPSGEAELIMKQYWQRQQLRQETMWKVRRVLGTSGAGLGARFPEPMPGAGEWPGGFQHGGAGIASRPMFLKVGERGPERYSISPLTSIGQSLTLRWAGGPIQVQGSGMEGFDAHGMGTAIAQGIILEMQRNVTTMRGTA